MAIRHEFLVVVDGLDLTTEERNAIETAIKSAAATALGELSIQASSSPLQDEVAEQAFGAPVDEFRHRRPTMGIVFRPGRGE